MVGGSEIGRIRGAITFGRNYFDDFAGFIGR